MDKYPAETRLILTLKREGRLSLIELSEQMGMSKMGVLNHIKRLEGKGMVERHLVKTNVGRPYYVFSTAEKSRENVASSEGWLLDELMDFLARTDNGKLVADFLKERYTQMRVTYEERLSKKNGAHRVEELARIREEENYFPELKSSGKDSLELLEYNCPIFKISKNFGIACSMESQLFSSVLDMNVSSTHRQVDGSDVCRFLIRKKDETQ